jgi:hypothetical protein
MVDEEEECEKWASTSAAMAIIGDGEGADALVGSCAATATPVVAAAASCCASIAVSDI